ncbi:MAG: alpha/beta fold hydrolase [Gammaproteobacteria bacterium]|nr:alpha/beta fold hydrolase [Gammaproteobacteria bacterium]
MSIFNPPRVLRNPHVQTLMASQGRKPWVRRRAHEVTSHARETILQGADGTRLQAWLSNQSVRAPTVVIIHGWLGSADSSYVLSAGAELWKSGFNVARLNLRDHGDTAHLNEDLFHSARTTEVVDAVLQIRDRHAAEPCGVMGFSLGGNFALRIGRTTGLPTLAVCPAIDPFDTMCAIDNGWIGYRWYFVRKWHRALWSKQLAFPDRFDFAQALNLRSITTLTDLFVSRYTPFQDTSEYLASYTLTGETLSDTQATIVMAADDPVIPKRGFRSLPKGIEIIETKNGGHCGFVNDRRSASWLDHFATDFFNRELRSNPIDTGAYTTSSGS